MNKQLCHPSDEPFIGVKRSSTSEPKRNQRLIQSRTTNQETKYRSSKRDLKHHDSLASTKTGLQYQKYIEKPASETHTVTKKKLNYAYTERLERLWIKRAMKSTSTPREGERWKNYCLMLLMCEGLQEEGVLL
uniref:Uncharacterized protein n=1 Tax=Oryza brachyantha TaxID=4533 RepID=J3KVY6_ORYBR